MCGRNIQDKSEYYIPVAIKEELDKQTLDGKGIVQFCCNSGRELLSIVKHYPVEGGGFDIAENIIAQGKEHAR